MEELSPKTSKFSPENSNMFFAHEKIEKKQETISIPDCFRFDLEDLKNKPMRELSILTLSSLGDELGENANGKIWIMEKDPSIVLKFNGELTPHTNSSSSKKNFLRKCRTYLYAKNLNNPSLRIPQFRGIYYIPPALFKAKAPELQSLDPQPYLYCLEISRIEGENLQDLVDRLELNEDHLRNLEQFLGINLKEFHEVGIIHSDIRPQNIMVCPNLSEACFVDFNGVLKKDQSHNFASYVYYDVCCLRNTFLSCYKYLRQCSEGTNEIGMYCGDIDHVAFVDFPKDCDSSREDSENDGDNDGKENRVGNGEDMGEDEDEGEDQNNTAASQFAACYIYPFLKAKFGWKELGRKRKESQISPINKKKFR